MAPSCGTIQVIPEFDPSNVIVSCNVGSESAAVGESVTIPIDVVNENASGANYDVTVLLNGTTAATISGTVSANSSTNDSASVQLNTPGQVDVNIEATASRL